MSIIEVCEVLRALSGAEVAIVFLPVSGLGKAFTLLVSWLRRVLAVRAPSAADPPGCKCEAAKSKKSKGKTKSKKKSKKKKSKQ